MCRVFEMIVRADHSILARLWTLRTLLLVRLISGGKEVVGNGRFFFHDLG